MKTTRYELYKNNFKLNNKYDTFNKNNIFYKQNLKKILHAQFL